MFVFDTLVSAGRELFAQTTKPITASSGIFVILRICSIVTIVSFLLAVVNDYDVINCSTDGKDVSLPAGNDRDREVYNFLKAASTLCYMQASFVIVNWSKENEIPSFGIGNAESNEIISTEYYQWVPFVLFFLCGAYRVPEMLWELSDGGHTKTLLNGLDRHMDEAEINLRISASASYFVRSLTKRSFPFAMVAFDYLGVLILWASIFLMDLYLDGRFIGGLFKGMGLLIFSSYEDFSKFMYEIFPKVTKCTFEYYGPSGTMQLKDFICLLPLNILYEKLFLILWITIAVSTGFTSVLIICNSLLCLCSSKYEIGPSRDGTNIKADYGADFNGAQFLPLRV